MADDTPRVSTTPKAERKAGGYRWLLWILYAMLGLVALVVAVGLALDTSPGRRFVVDRIEALRPANGMIIHIGRIDGSIYRNPVIRDLRLDDQKGEFFRADAAQLEWSPLQYLLANRLDIDTLTVPHARLHRLPEFVPSGEDQAFLPDFDIRIGKFDIRRMDYGAAISGEPRSGSLSGKATVADGVADVNLNADIRGAGDRLRLVLKAEPDRGVFDVDADLVAPAGSVLAALMGTDRPIAAVVRGAGNWERWTGSLIARSNTDDLARLQLGMTDGKITALGKVWPEYFVSGLPQRVVAGGVAVDLAGTLKNRVWNGSIALLSNALRIDAVGGADLGGGGWQAMRVDTWLRNGKILADGVDARNAHLSLLLDGGWTVPRYEYRLVGDRLVQGDYVIEGLLAQGKGTLSGPTAAIPVQLGWRSIRGVAPMIDPRLSNFRATGMIRRQGTSWLGDGLRMTASGLDARVGFRYAPDTSDLMIDVNGGMPGVDIDSIGRADLTLNAVIRSVRGGPFTVSGHGRALMRRLTNPSIHNLLGGLPDLSTDLSYGADRVLRLTNARLRSPALNLTGSGQRLANGLLRIDVRGTHRDYGPLEATVEGELARPKVILFLRSPVPAAEIKDVRLVIEPDPTGFAITVNGQSMLGPFDGNGQLVLPAQGAARINVHALNVSDSTASGVLTIAGGGVAGQLAVTGGGLDGQLVMSVPQGVQKIDANFTLRNARFRGDPPIAVSRGQVQATVLLDPKGTDIDATFELTGVMRGNMAISRLAGNAHLVNGEGTVRASVAGSRGSSFSFNTGIAIRANSYAIAGNGTLGGRAIRLTRPAIVTRSGDAWTLAPTELTFAGGTARVSGTMSGRGTTVEAGLDNLSLELVQMVMPDAGIGGRISGRLSYADMAGANPTGNAEIRVTGLTRAGLVDVSQPVDIALNARLQDNTLGSRVVIERNGRTIGRAQARLSPLGGSGPLLDRAMRAPLFAQLRYSGDAAPLWKMSGIEALALSGPVSIAADVNGTLNDPQIRGVVRAQGARFESAQTGTVLTGVQAVGRFDGSILRISELSGATQGGGTVTGSGEINLSPASGFAMRLGLQAEHALIMQRDDLTARVTGPVTIARGPNGNLISGRLTLDSGSFKLGQATAAEALPVINVVEINLPADRQARVRTVEAPWRLDLAIQGRNQFRVTGMGLDSMWSTNVTVRGEVTNFAIVGTAELARGDFTFAGRRFELESGTIRFDGSTPMNPRLDIVAVDDISGIDATIHVRGTGLRPEISFTSSPPLPEDELLSRILFGSSITDISVTEAAQLGLAVAALRDGSGGLDPINAIRQATGLDRLRILPADASIGSSTSVAAGKYITRRIFVEVITDGRDYSATRAEYQITRWLSVLATISTLNRESVTVRIQRDY